MRLTGERTAAVILAAATVVILGAPILLDAPNFLALPAAAFAAWGAIGALFAGKPGRRLALAVSLLGATMSALWGLGASNGFGKGTPWWDDLAEATILLILFAGSAIVLMRRPSAVGV
jgi:hypothetical protein